MNKFKGIIPPVSTIFDEEGKLSEVEMAQLIDRLIEAGVDGLLFLGTGGEFSQMSREERLQTAEFAVRHVKRRVPVLIGTGSTNTREAVELSVHAQKIGADGVMVINPFYWKLTDDNLYGYFSKIAQSVDIPVLLYNFPNLTGQDLSPEFVARLVDDHPNISGIKETVDSIGHIRDMIMQVKRKHPHFSVLCGYDDHLLNTLQLGGDGTISASGNFAPQISIGIYRAFLNGDLVKASILYKQLAILPQLYKLDSPFVNVIKEAIKQCGLDISTYVLPPSAPLNEKKISQVKEILAEAGVLPAAKS
ncbi:MULTISPECIES: dihydrodipicolinate synthase family protein [unclassified Niallia]|uniref:dihydrodipicolinate synthase family protein n=1 Tax=unclassified Niallia TaxID=2837522 RepID=UPI001EDB2C4A|nr:MULTISPECIES: dihydrodipicolinate synthase family protein [unclassified Niallia]MCM3029343.1 dihydrodipicolinate synthase family protein [Niallia sp. MER 6]MDL0434438.1 dihydrodipicolinate synthase family protein [Niallia sp. SS-2023]UPO88589.1 dihydrodipicolinate synthase family protein [Niallia sp. Man26]